MCLRHLAPALLLACVAGASRHLRLHAQNRTSTGVHSKQSSPISYTVSVLREVPHEKPAAGLNHPFTQGLEFTTDGYLVETSGNYPSDQRSYIRVLDPNTGKTLRMTSQGLESRFVEGITRVPSSGNWLASTFQNHKIVEYDGQLQNVIAEHEYPQVGWGLTRHPDGQHYLATNGSESLIVLHPTTFATVSAQKFTCLGKPVSSINELELVDNFDNAGPAVFGNLYSSRLVIAFDPYTAQCTHVFQLEGPGLVPVDHYENMGFKVANGIAYNVHTGNFFVTGKNWKSMYEIKLQRDPAGTEGVALRALRQRLEITDLIP
eukprot:gnl/TRDRNA2_/TRDRNA2_185293_c0_seq1.p1 gnl/TRDRNA2_/TRDRNA2_185293_c0~~gnl/TRDRNA2_/TRDRNA2_185293_c0_seq1.p1  ORF type:complete len:319 (+),score=46.13 gnl/TRDRNA2_/TRDRNA2_185293_c0_seq1:101-1057(+)